MILMLTQINTINLFLMWKKDKHTILTCKPSKSQNINPNEYSCSLFDRESKHIQSNAIYSNIFHWYLYYRIPFSFIYSYKWVGFQRYKLKMKTEARLKLKVEAKSDVDT